LLATAVPFTTITDQSFASLLQENPARIPAINTVKSDIKIEYDKSIQEMKNHFNKVDYVCLTADCWTSFNRYA